MQKTEAEIKKIAHATWQTIQQLEQHGGAGVNDQITYSNYTFKLHIQISHSNHIFKSHIQITCSNIQCAYMYVYKCMRIHVRMHVTCIRAFKCTYIHTPSSNKLEQHGAVVDDQIHRTLNAKKNKENSTLHTSNTLYLECTEK